MVYCKSCGTQESDSSAKFCSVCGTALKAQLESNIQKQQIPSESLKFVKKDNMVNNQGYDNSAYKLDQLKSNVQLVAVFDIIVGIFTLLISILLFGVRRLIVTNSHHFMDDPFEARGAMFGANIILIIAVVIFIYAIVAIISGIGLLKGKSWARISSMVVGGMAILNFPLGSIFGGLSIYYLSRPGIETVLSK